MSKPIDAIRELEKAEWYSRQIANEIWIGRSIGEFDEKRVKYIEDLAAQIRDITNDLLTVEKERGHAQPKG